MPKINDIKIAPISTLTGDEILYTVKDDQDRNFTTDTLKAFIGEGTKGSSSSTIIDYNPADYVTVGGVAVENASVAVGWNGTELSINGTPNTVMVNSGTADPAREAEYVAIKIPFPTSGSFEVDLSQLNGSMMQIHMSGAEQTLEQLIANYTLAYSNPYNFISITGSQELFTLLKVHNETGNSANGGLLTSTRKKIEFFSYLEFFAVIGEDLSSLTPEQQAEYELTYANLRMLSITDADTGANRLYAPINITDYPYIYFTLVANYSDNGTTSVVLNPNSKLLINFDGIGSVSYELPEIAKDGDYLRVLSDVKLLGTDLVSGDYFQLYDGKSKGIPYRQDEFYSKLLGSVVIPPVTTESVIPLIDLGIVDVLPNYGKNGQRVIHRYYHSYSGQHRFITYYWYDSRGWVSDFDIKSSDDVKEGFLNQYLTTERFDSNINDRWKTTGIQYGNEKFPTSSAVHGYVTYALSSKVDIAALTTLAQLVDTKADQSYVVAEIARIVGSAPAALDTLAEIAAQLGNDETQINNLLTQIGNRVRFDTAQALTAPQQTQARDNINAEAKGVAASLVSGVTAASIGAATAAQGTKADSALQPNDVSTAGKTGSYNDLTNKPNITGTLLAGLTTVAASAISATDSIIGALAKLQASINAKQNSLPTTGTAGQFLAHDMTFKTPAEGGGGGDGIVWTELVVNTMGNWQSGFADGTHKLSMGLDTNNIVWIKGAFKNNNASGVGNANLIAPIPSNRLLRVLTSNNVNLQGVIGNSLYLDNQYYYFKLFHSFGSQHLGVTSSGIGSLDTVYIPPTPIAPLKP